MRSSSTPWILIVFTLLAPVCTLDADGLRILNERSKQIASERSDSFGETVTLYGDTLVAGTFDRFGTGAAYVLEREAGGWTETAILVSADAELYDRFGSAVSLWRDRLVVGAAQSPVPGDGHLGGDPDGIEIDPGAAYVFERDPQGDWNEVRKLIPSVRVDGDHFGDAVSLSGNGVAVGALAVDRVHLFARNAGGPDAWSEVAQLDGPPESSFGAAVALGARALVVGAPDDDTVDEGAGAVFVYEPRESELVLSAVLTADDGRTHDSFGGAVAIYGSTIAVGAPWHSSGSVYLFEREADGVWTRSAKLAPDGLSTFARYGDALALQGDRLVVGARGNARGFGGANKGSVFVHRRDLDGRGAWGLAAELQASDADIGDSLGESVAIQGSTILVGAGGDDDWCPWNDTCNSGALYFYGAMDE